MQQAVDRLDWVDMAKGLSILLVVMMHSAFGVGEETGGVGYLHYIIGWATPFRMPEFFAISGLFLFQVIGRPWASFADRRVVHYLYFYALWAVIQIVFKVGLGAGDPVTAASWIAWSIVEPFGVLWFIYMLAVVSAVSKVLHDARVPAWVVLPVAAALNLAPIHVGSYVVDQFAEYFVYFYAGAVFAPAIFRLVFWAQNHMAAATLGLLVWAVLEGALVFLPASAVLPGTIVMGYTAHPLMHLVMAIVGIAALCVLAALLARLPFTDWLRWLGSKSLVIYVAFSLPMAITRVIGLRLGLGDNTSVLSTLVMLSAVLGPLVLYWLVRKTGWGTWLFERPAWAHIPGTPGSRQPRAVATPAE